MLRLISGILVTLLLTPFLALVHAQEPSQQLEIPVARGGVSLMGVSGNAILDRCTKQSDRDQEYCLAWMRLALDNRKSLKAIVPDLPDCIPQEVDDTQLRDVAVEYLRAHPKGRHLAATPLVTEAFIEAWPCQRAKSALNDSLLQVQRPHTGA